MEFGIRATKEINMRITVDARFGYKCYDCGDHHFSDYEKINHMAPELIDGKLVLKLDLGSCRCGRKIEALIQPQIINKDQIIAPLVSAL